MKLISAIVPCYNEEENVPYFYEEFMKNKAFFDTHDLTYELIYVDDGSSDGTVSAVKKLIAQDKKVKLISFSRNFGKESAMYAGMQHAKGDYVAIMDADLQDPPSLLPEMYEWLQQGYECAATRRVDRKGEPPIRSFFARKFYALMKRFSSADIVDGARDYRLMSRKFVNAVLSLKEVNRFSKGIFGWVGYKTKWVEFENVERRHGETKWSFWKLFVYAVEGIVDFTTVPLTIAAFLGVVLCLFAFVMLLFVWIRAMLYGDPVAGWPSMVCIMLLVAGVQMFFLGIIGEYLAKAYQELKARPIYLVQELVDEEESGTDPENS
ncbi:MAG: glycosyltransferase family 2 protein [Lachnospiraceae bacterium]|nr:glycosyltransferase family 2 protein [Lachnospiraceae bacterium]